MEKSKAGEGICEKEKEVGQSHSSPGFSNLVSRYVRTITSKEPGKSWEDDCSRTGNRQPLGAIRHNLNG